MPFWFYILAQITIIAYALVGGVFLGFSDFIMRSLTNTSGRGGAEAMQAINREVFRWIFMTLFIGLVPVSLVIGGYGILMLPAPAGLLASIASGLYVIGCFGITAVCNVPLNNKLADLDVSKNTTLEFWHNVYLPRWTFWNSVRTVACIAASGLLLFTLLQSLSVQVT